MCLGGTLYFRNLLFLKYKVSSNLHLPNANAAFFNFNNFILRKNSVFKKKGETQDCQFHKLNFCNLSLLGLNCILKAFLYVVAM